MTFARRKIDTSFALGTGAFGDDGANVVTLSGLRTSARITKAGGASMGELQLSIYGMSMSLMNRLSTLGKTPLSIRNNTVSVSAGSDASGMGMVFQGTISEAWADLQGAPQAVFYVTAYSGLLQAVEPASPSSFKGAVDVAAIMSGLATQMGLSFENSGVSVMLSNPYLSGTARTQAEACARAADVNWIIDNGVLAIWPKGQSRGGLIPLVSPETGMVGYPTYTATGIVVTTEFNPSIGYGQSVKVESSLTPACGVWSIYSLAHDLESEMPGGSWFTRFEGAPLGYAPLR